MRTIVTRKRLIHVAGTPLLVARHHRHHRFPRGGGPQPVSRLPRHAERPRQPGASLRTARRGARRISRTATRAVWCSIDLDRFKQVNDAFGHAAGDELIIDFGKRLTSLVRATDTVARLGGDEFAILLPGGLPPKRSTACARRILEAARSPFPVAGVSVHVGASIGIVSERCAGSQPQRSAPQGRRRALQRQGGGRAAASASTARRWTKAGPLRLDDGKRTPGSDPHRRGTGGLLSAALFRIVDGGRRGAGAMEPSAPRLSDASAIHTGRRGDRADRSARRSGPRQGMSAP